VLIGEITKHVGIDRIVAKRLRVLLQTNPAEPTVDVQVQSPGLLSPAVFKKGCVIGTPRDSKGLLEQPGFAMWTPTTRQQHSRPVTRYQTDLTDAEWRVIAPHLPKPRATGRPRAWPMREIVNGIFYVMRAGCPWRLLLERRSTDVSAMRSWTPTGAASCSNRTRRVSKTAIGGGPLLRISRRIFPSIQRVFADSGYAGEKID
jgi:hypothetical protein